MSARAPLSTLLSRVVVVHTIELDNEFEHRFTAAGGGARITSLVMWSNFLRFVGDGITVGELPNAAGIPKGRTLSTLGGLERWRYIAVGPAGKRDGYGTARGVRGDWVVRPTSTGRKAMEIWPALFREIEGRWEKRFGADAIDELRRSLRAIVGRLGVKLPEYLPIVDGKNGLAAELLPLEAREAGAGELPLSALLSQALLMYTIDFEQESELSLPLSENVVRVLDESGVLVRDLPVAAGTSKEAIAMALAYLAKNDYVTVSGTTAATKRVRLKKKGRKAHAGRGLLHAQIQKGLAKRFGADELESLRSSVERVLDQREALSGGLEPYPDGWRASKPYLERTQALVKDPLGALPHYPMVLHRGGWPDGS